MSEELDEIPNKQDKIDSALLNLAQIQVDFEDCETELVKQVNNCFLGVRPNRQHEIVDSIETQLDSLKYVEYMYIFFLDELRNFTIRYFPGKLQPLGSLKRQKSEY